MTITGTLTRNTEPHQKCSSRKPEAIGPIAAPPPETPAQIAMACVRSWAGNTLVRIDSVEGITNAAARPMTARAPMTMPDVSANAANTAPTMNSDEAELEGALAAEAVADGAGGEEHAGEDQRVGVDHPLQRRRRGVELAGQRRQRDVEAWCCR